MGHGMEETANTYFEFTLLGMILNMLSFKHQQKPHKEGLITFYR